ncbi:hypothetical protein MMC28_006960 [Mycoblastus sanguinarius]|nr:hypothetical protein [Mycoblastus sanguinarius]
MFCSHTATADASQAIAQSPEHPANPVEAKKIASLKPKISALEAQIKETEEKQTEIEGKLETRDPQAIVKEHIRLLHDYNEIRDIGQGLMGIIADNKGVRVKDVYKDFDVDEGD